MRTAIGASGAFGQDLEDSFEVPGLDSQEAADLLTAARSDQVGLTAQVVLTPRDERATFFDAADARAALARVQAAVADLPKVLDTTDPAGAAAAGPEAAGSGAILIVRGRDVGSEMRKATALDAVASLLSWSVRYCVRKAPAENIFRNVEAPGLTVSS